MKYIGMSSLESVSSDLIDSILSCYRENCKYVKKAGVYSGENMPLEPERKALLSMKSEIFIPESCYIDDTGHFNAVEFNICYNQMIYILMAYGVMNKILNIGIVDLDEFKARMLPDIFIVEMENKFKRDIKSSRLYGTVSIHRCFVRKNITVLKTSCQFFDDFDGHHFGDITLAIVNRE